MSKVVLYGLHLQIVTDRERHDALKDLQISAFPESIIVTPAVLQLYHAKQEIQYLDNIHHKSPNAVWYILPLGSYGAHEGYHCNGVRYGTERGDYVSLPQIKLITGE